jgi:molybdopterin/thiamine biosynthesis adenylyltransferase
VLERKTLVDGAVREMTGMAMTMRGGETTCYRCLLPVPPPPDGAPSCSEAGVLGPVPGVVGAVQALEVLTGVGEPLYDRLLQSDGVALTFHEVAVARSTTCPVCGPRLTITEVGGDDA